MKTYFVQFDFWNEEVNKFNYSIVSVDLNNTDITAVCRDLIEENFDGIDPNSVTIKINAFNNIDL